MFDPAAIRAIPGMIESVEQQTLYALSAKIALQPADQIVEFGSFFGRSTACLAQGLAANPQRTPGNCIHAYDSFGCANGDGFAVHVRSFAENGGVAHLLRADQGRVDFMPIFEHYLAGSVREGLVHPVRAELRDSEPAAIRQIVLMHIDSPKFYQELRVLVERFFPRLRDGAIVIFQDYFYHWSATLIAAVEAMRQLGVLDYRLSSASSLVTQTARQMPSDLPAVLDKQMSDPARVHDLIMNAIAASQQIQLDRPEVFIPRLWLAAYQHLWSLGETAEATDLIGTYFSAGGKLIQPVLDDYLEMMRAGFSVRELYEQDHE